MARSTKELMARRWPDFLASPVVAVRIATVLVLLALYEGLARSGLLFKGVLPPLHLIVTAIFALPFTTDFFYNLGVTVFEVSSGFVLGSASGIVIGLLFASQRFLGKVLNPWVHFLAPAPKIIFLPILVLMFGIDAGSKIAMATISAFFPVALSTYASLTMVRPVLLRVMSSFNASRWQVARIVFLPSLVVPTLVSMRLGLGGAIIGALLAEVKMSRAGLGYLITQAYNFFEIDEMYALLIVVFLIAWLANFVLDACARAATRAHFR
jgi:NitT/TauT family transport system permease protein